MMQLSKLESRLNYQFVDGDLLMLALTHRSFGSANNERLEFLGDSILNLVITRSLYERFPGATEGQMSRLRAKLVRRATLADIARQFALGDFMIMGRGEIGSGGFARDSILSDTVEAIIGAIFIDGGFDVAEEKILLWYKTQWGELSLSEAERDAKSKLQEYLQAMGLPLPRYEVIDVSGLAHDQLFKVACSSEILPESVLGEGGSRRIAEQEAAKLAVAFLEQSL
tara:strand:+ start:466 stop:1143 length:678 start_codon:yes stop_codon:yes gene_type:complete